jgi:alkylhydroperoxidase/carboxymuconolactone decarboxylase family protein YurZ
VAFDDYKRQLRRLAMHDDAVFEEIAVNGSSFAAPVIDERTQALARVAATIAVDAANSSFQHTVMHALAVGVTMDEIVAVLEAVTPVTGARASFNVPRRSRWRWATTSTTRSSSWTGDAPVIIPPE